MTASVSCGGCGRRYFVKEELAGKQVRCRNCGASFVIPGAAGEVGVAALVAAASREAAAAAPRRNAETDTHQVTPPPVDEEDVAPKRSPARFGSGRSRPSLPW